MINPFLVGEKVYLRPLSPEDLNGNYQFWLNDPVLNLQNTHHVFPYAKSDLADYIANAFSRRDGLPLAIIDKATDRHIGNIALTNIDYVNSKSNWGIIIGEKEYWGKGFSKEASFLLLRHAFENLNIQRIFSSTTAVNAGGRKLMEAMGMVREGVSRNHLYKNGRYIDMINYGVLKEEFFKKFGLRQ
jgi:RimJ/RimL family protein N-acetyltransferase